MTFVEIGGLVRSATQFVSSAKVVGHVPVRRSDRDDESVMSTAVFSQYLDRIGLPGVTRTIRPDLQLLETIVTAQLAAIPFENFDIHLGRPVDVTVEVIEEKLVRQRRGGICYELNGLLARALRTVGFDAQLTGASVLADGVPGPPLGHVAVVVDLDGEYRLADAGFGGDAVSASMSDLGPVDVLFPGGTAYRTEGSVRPLADFAAMAWWHSTSPLARFTRTIVCSVTARGVRHTLSCSPGHGYRLGQTNGAVRRTRELEDSEVRSVLVRDFGIELPEVPYQSSVSYPPSAGADASRQL
ncbi:N-hydroxyarylamine O-acetyltransferase [Rhodococcus sp. 27YEA15]|uniref:arylamine N-acetyltransferase family protein n=1 Tax=Rhodococcus sp. 27YEA15 TaxID=3156259 RepID=UPI003C7A0958